MDGGGLGPFWASEGVDTSALEIRQPLEVVVGGHHGHGEVGSCLADSSNEFATHLVDGCKHVLDPSAGFGDEVVALVLSWGQGFVAIAFGFELCLVLSALLYDQPQNYCTINLKTIVRSTLLLYDQPQNYCTINPKTIVRSTPKNFKKYKKNLLKTLS